MHRYPWLALVARQFAGLPLRDFIEKSLTRLLGRWREVRVFRLMALDSGSLAEGGDGHDGGDGPGGALPAGFSARYIGEAECLAFAAIADAGLREEFVRAACARGDRCLAVFDGAEPAAYSWYADTATTLPGDLEIRFDPGWVYHYHSHTRPAWRGRRLHAAGVRAALRDVAAAGRPGLVSAVEVQNYESLRAMRRLGFRIIGSAYVAWFHGRPHIAHSPGCRRHAVRLAIDPQAPA